MHRAWIISLRALRRSLAAAVAVALLLPALLTLLPQPALSASAALDRDLAHALCNPLGGPQDESAPVNHADHGHCILCGTSCPACSPTLTPAGAAFATRPAITAAATPREHVALVPLLLALIDTSPPRGPPAFS